MLALWYQGESNANDPPAAYQCQLESLVAEWRGAFNRTVLPFFVVQLAPYWEPECKNVTKNAATPCGIGANSPAIRIAQARAMASAEAESGAPSGVCITHDIGDIAGGIHPHNKTEVSRRLALEIRTKVFGATGESLNTQNVVIQFMIYTYSQTHLNGARKTERESVPTASYHS